MNRSGSCNSEEKRTPSAAPSARVAFPLTLKPLGVDWVGSTVRISAPSAPTFRLEMLVAVVWLACSVPLATLTARVPSASRIAPVTAAPPVMFSASAPAPKLMSPTTVPFSTLKVSAPEPRRT